jgi:hypothetical protein
MKYRPDFPEFFGLPASAGKKWCALFFRNRKPCFSQQCQG